MKYVVDLMKFLNHIVDSGLLGNIFLVLEFKTVGLKKVVK